MHVLKGMNRKKKIEYIWEYYKIHIIGTIVFLLILASIISDKISEIDYVFNLTMIGNVVDSYKSEDLGKQLTKIVVNQGEKRKQVAVDNISFEGSSSDESIMSSQQIQKFISQISVGESDIVALDKGLFETLAKRDMFLRLDNISQLDLAKIKNKKIEASGGDSNKAVYAIDVEDIKIFKDMEFATQNKVMAIISSCKQKDKALLVLKWLLNA